MKIVDPQSEQSGARGRQSNSPLKASWTKICQKTETLPLAFGSFVLAIFGRFLAIFGRFLAIFKHK